MAFKPDRPIPFNDLAHLDADTIAFALAMREGPPKDDKDWMNGLSEDERLVIEEENKQKARERRQKPCTEKKCKATEAAVGLQILERLSLLKKIEAVQEKMKEASEDLLSLAEAQESTGRESNQLEDKLATLKHKEKKELKEASILANREHKQLEIQIIKAKAELTDLRNAEDAEAEKANEQAEQAEKTNTHISCLPSVNFETLPKKHAPKHTGKFEMSASGFHMWSCCQAMEKDDTGCEDDQSVGVRG